MAVVLVFFVAVVLLAVVDFFGVAFAVVEVACVVAGVFEAVADCFF